MSSHMGGLNWCQRKHIHALARMPAHEGVAMRVPPRPVRTLPLESLSNAQHGRRRERPSTTVPLESVAMSAANRHLTAPSAGGTATGASTELQDARTTRSPAARIAGSRSREGARCRATWQVIWAEAGTVVKARLVHAPFGHVSEVLLDARAIIRATCSFV